MTQDREEKLKIIEIKSRCPVKGKAVDDPLRAVGEMFDDKGWVVVYLDYRVLVGKYDPNGFSFPENEQIEAAHIQKIRVFNDSREFFAWRTGSGFKVRLRIDGEGEDTPVIEADQVLWGTKIKESAGGFSRIYEDRGTELTLPFAVPETLDDKDNRLFLRTCNYIDYNEVNQATYVDSRFLGFTFGPGRDRLQ